MDEVKRHHAYMYSKIYFPSCKFQDFSDKKARPSWNSCNSRPDALQMLRPSFEFRPKLRCRHEDRDRRCCHAVPRFPTGFFRQIQTKSPADAGKEERLRSKTFLLESRGCFPQAKNFQNPTENSPIARPRTERIHSRKSQPAPRSATRSPRLESPGYRHFPRRRTETQKKRRKNPFQNFRCDIANRERNSPRKPPSGNANFPIRRKAQRPRNRRLPSARSRQARAETRKPFAPDFSQEVRTIPDSRVREFGRRQRAFPKKSGRTKKFLPYFLTGAE